MIATHIADHDLLTGLRLREVSTSTKSSSCRARRNVTSTTSISIPKCTTTTSIHRLVRSGVVGVDVAREPSAF